MARLSLSLSTEACGRSLSWLSRWGILSLSNKEACRRDMRGLPGYENGSGTHLEAGFVEWGQGRGPELSIFQSWVHVLDTGVCSGSKVARIVNVIANPEWKKLQRRNFLWNYIELSHGRSILPALLTPGHPGSWRYLELVGFHPWNFLQGPWVLVLGVGEVFWKLDLALGRCSAHMSVRRAGSTSWQCWDPRGRP